MSKVTSWGDRFALINHYKPTDDTIKRAFGITQNQLDTARVLYQAGTIRVNPKIEPEKYGEMFNPGTTKQPTVQPDIVPSPSVTVHPNPTQPQQPAKRGRSGNKITNALHHVPTQPVPIDDFVKTVDVSVAVLRQAKRFIQKLSPEEQAEIGTINVRQDKTTKQLMIWKS
jgi:hypothetical protein